MPMKEKTYAPRIMNAGVRSFDGVELAAPFSDDEARNALGVDSAMKTYAPLFAVGRCVSTFDAAWELAAVHEAPPWSAVIALSQTNGRGQMRREWRSPPGNLYVSFFLPTEAARMNNLLALAVGVLVRNALACEGVEALLKWPNDILAVVGHGAGKAGGILLEERAGRILAGVGLNLRHAPEFDAMRHGSAIPAVVLPELAGSPCAVWIRLAEHMRRLYETDMRGASLGAIRRLAEDVLAWRGRVVFSDDLKTTGVLAGVNDDGALLLRTASGDNVVVDSGSVFPADTLRV